MIFVKNISNVLYKDSLDIKIIKRKYYKAHVLLNIINSKKFNSKLR